MLLSSLGAEQDVDLDTASSLLAGGDESDLQDALGAGLMQDETASLIDDDEAAANMAALLNAPMPVESEPSEALALPQAVWATMQQAASAEGQRSVKPGAGMALQGGEGASAKAGQAGAKRTTQMGQAGQAGQEGQGKQAAKTAQAGQAEANPAAAAAAQAARSKAQASAGAERAAQQVTNAAAAAQSVTTQAAAPQATQRPVSWTQRVAAAQQRAQGAEPSKSSAARSGDASRAGTQTARDAAAATPVQEWAAWADTSAARLEHSGEFRPGTADWSAGGMSVSVAGSAAPESSSATSSIGNIRPEDGMPEGAAAPEMEVAEQVSFLVGRGARNASISVQGLTENPIRIRILMEGQEASIQFFAEQEQTREVLSEATPHLRELLEREGLTLGEVSVGSSSAQQQAGAAGERDASSGGAGRGGRDRKAAEPEEVIVARPAPRNSGLPSGRSVDLFV